MNITVVSRPDRNGSFTLGLFFAIAALVAGCSSSPNVVQAAPPACDTTQAADLEAGVRAYNGRETEIAFQKLKAAADCGNSDAQVNLGYMYARGEAVPINQQEALRLYQLSADHGNGEGMNAIGYKYQYGTGLTIDIQKAIYWYCKAIERGNPRALNNLGLLYSRGYGVPKDIEVAKSLWLQAGERGHLNGIFNVGSLYLNSPNVADREYGAKLEIEAAQEGNAAAQALLRSRGYRDPLPPPSDEAGQMKIQRSDLPPGHAPICTNEVPVS